MLPPASRSISAGNAYITGYTFSTDFPTANAYQAACDNCGNGPDVFVTKLNATGTALVYSTYLGGSGLRPRELHCDRLPWAMRSSAVVTSSHRFSCQEFYPDAALATQEPEAASLLRFHRTVRR